MSYWKKYLLWFAHEHVHFRAAEFQSIIKLFGLEFRKLSEASLKPFWIVEFPSEETALKYASRAIALRSIFELWAHNTTEKELHNDLRNYVNVNNDTVSKYFQPGIKFKITVDTFNTSFSHEVKVNKIESLDYLPIKGAVDLKFPDVEWWYIEFWGLDHNNVPEKAEEIYFGRQIAVGQRQLIKELSLKKRKFIGNTSMDPQLSLLMANQALVQNGDIVFDPFVGSGSLLVSAAKFGGYVLGADIDYMMLHARCRPSRVRQKKRETDESIRNNLEQYSCAHRYLDAIVSDFSNTVWRSDLKLDAILTDPPYGLREATEKVESKQSTKLNTRTIDVPHYPSTSHYALEYLYLDLLNFAARHLKIGGRLVCWLPYHRDDYSESIVPRHPNLALVANSEQILSTNTSRRLLTYEKHIECNDSEIGDSSFNESFVSDFRQRYFNNSLESRTERRLKQADLREKGRLEALKRGKVISNGKEYKCELNKARFS